MTNSWLRHPLGRRTARLVLIGLVLGLATLFAVTAQLLRAAEPLKVAGLPVT